MGIGFLAAIDFYDPGQQLYCTACWPRAAHSGGALAVLWMELAQGLGHSRAGRGFSGHFLIKDQPAHGPVVIDPSTTSRSAAKNCPERLEPYRRSGLHEAMDARWGCSAETAAARHHRPRALATLAILNPATTGSACWPWNAWIVLLPECWSEAATAVWPMPELGNTEQALANLEYYLVHADESVDSDTVADWVDVLRRSWIFFIYPGRSE